MTSSLKIYSQNHKSSKEVSETLLMFLEYLRALLGSQRDPEETFDQAPKGNVDQLSPSEMDSLLTNEGVKFYRLDLNESNMEFLSKLLDLPTVDFKKTILPAPTLEGASTEPPATAPERSSEDDLFDFVEPT